MSALADDYPRDRKPTGPVEYTIKDNEILYDGALIVVDTTSGEAEAGTDAAGKVFVGVHYGARLDNTDDGLYVQPDKSRKFRVASSGLAVGDVGKNLYLVDDNTVGLRAASTYYVYVGRLDTYLSATECWCDPTVAEDLTNEVQVVADPAAATSTNGTFTSIASALASAPSITTSPASAIASASFSATPTSAELAAFAALVAPLATDARALASIMASNVAVAALELAEAEKAADDARAARTSAAAAINALQALGLFSAS